MKICMIIPYYYKWSSFSNIKSTYELLQKLGHKVDLFSRDKKSTINYNEYDQIWLMGAGAQITKKEFDDIKSKVIAFGWSDPNLYSEEHMKNCDLYCTNDLNIYRETFKIKPVYYHQTACDKKYHKNLHLEKTTDILVYGIGNHKFIPDRNIRVNKLREKGFKVTVFGRGWDKHPDTHNFIQGQNFLREINKAKILLDLTNNSTALGHRIFEGTGCGTAVFTKYREDTSLFFEDGKEIIMYSDFSSLELLVRYYLYYPKSLAKISENGQQRCYKDHDITIRLPKLLTFLKENL